MAPRNGIDLDAVRRGVGMWYEANVNAQGDQEAEDQEDEGLEDESQEDEDQENDDQEAENQENEDQETEGQTNRDERQVHFDDTQNVLVEYTIPQGATMRPFRSGRRRRGSDAGGAEAGPAGDVPDEEQPREGREERAADTPEDEPAEEEDTSGQEMAQVFGRFDPEIEAIENDLTVGQLEESAADVAQEERGPRITQLSIRRLAAQALAAGVPPTARPPASGTPAPEPPAAEDAPDAPAAGASDPLTRRADCPENPNSKERGLLAGTDDLQVQTAAEGPRLDLPPNFPLSNPPPPCLPRGHRALSGPPRRVPRPGLPPDTPLPNLPGGHSTFSMTGQLPRRVPNYRNRGSGRLPTSLLVSSSSL